MIETGLDMSKPQAPGVRGDAAVGVEADDTERKVQQIINHLTRNERSRLRHQMAARAVKDRELTPERVVQLAFPQSPENGWDRLRRRSDGRIRQ